MKLTKIRRIRSRFSLDNDVTLHRTDCLKFLKQVPDCSAQLVVTSPPSKFGQILRKQT